MLTKRPEEWQEWPFEPIEILSALEKEEVRYLVIGGFASVIHGSPLPTYDLDITPELSSRNLERLKTALSVLEAQPLPSEQDLASNPTEFRTPFGYLSIYPTPAGTAGYEDLRRRAVTKQLDRDLSVEIAALADVARSKETLHRDSDLLQLVALRKVLEIQETV